MRRGKVFCWLLRRLRGGNCSVRSLLWEWKCPRLCKGTHMSRTERALCRARLASWGAPVLVACVPVQLRGALCPLTDYGMRGTKKMAEPLSNKKVAILVTDGFEQAELLEPLKALRMAGATVEI